MFGCRETPLVLSVLSSGGHLWLSTEYSQVEIMIFPIELENGDRQVGRGIAGIEIPNSSKAFSSLGSTGNK